MSVSGSWNGEDDDSPEGEGMQPCVPEHSNIVPFGAVQLGKAGYSHLVYG